MPLGAPQPPTGSTARLLKVAVTWPSMDTAWVGVGED